MRDQRIEAEHGHLSPPLEHGFLALGTFGTLDPQIPWLPLGSADGPPPPPAPFRFRFNNYMFVRVGNGMSASERIR